MTLQLGVLVPERRLHRLKAGEFRSWHAFVREQEEQFAVRPIFLSPRQIDLYTGTVSGLVAGHEGWKEQVLEPFPQFYYNRLVLPVHAEGRALRDLNGDWKVVLFNETNRWNKGMVYAMLESIPALQQYIPRTLPFKPDDERTLAQRGLYLLAPSRRAVREAGVLIKNEGASRVQYTMLSDGAVGELSLKGQDTLSRTLPENLRWISALGGWPIGPAGPVEWRVYLHRTSRATWTVAAALAKRDVLRGAHRERCWRLHEALTLSFGTGAAKMAERLHAISTAIAEALALFIPGIAHCALDFWIDRSGHPLLLDLSGHYRHDWLRRVGEFKALQQLRTHPARFARHLASTGGERLHVGFPSTAHPTGSGDLDSRNGLYSDY